MGRVSQYKTILTNFAEEFASIGSTNPPTVATVPVIDQEHGVFSVFDFGWHDDYRVNVPAFILRLVDHKVFIESNNTDWLLAEQLAKRGINSEDIVIAFQQNDVDQMVTA